NSFGIPSSVQSSILDEIQKVLGNLHRYPDREFIRLREALSGYLPGNPAVDQIWAANGSNEILQQFHQAFGGPGRMVLSFGPTYSMYPVIAKGTLTDYLELPRQEDYKLTADYVVDAINNHNPSVVILCNPNNPTGTSIGNDVIEAAYEATEGMLVVDEAYAEFSSSESAIELLVNRPRLVISRTMSKAFAFAGVRLGYLVADPAVIDAMRLVRLPYHLSSLTQAASIAAIENSGLMLSNVKQISQERERVALKLAELDLKVLPSESNFLFVEGFSDPRGVFDYLLSNGLIIRKTAIDGALRITIGTPSENDKLLELMPKALASLD
ncbi:MAG TPA: histidinol-phosphate transaminase, partial [Microbacteriaceae bacterium]